MTKCIQFNVNGKLFKFDNINVSDKDLSSVRNIFSKLSSIKSHSKLFTELLYELEHSSDEAGKLYSYSNVSDYADNTVGELTIRNISSAQKYSNIKNQLMLKFVRLLGSTCDEQIIKLTYNTDRPKLFVGNNRTIILANNSVLSDNTLSTYLGYLFLDKQSTRNESSIYNILNLAFQELLSEEELLSDSNPVKEIIKELKPLDTANRNKRLLAYTYNNIAKSLALTKLAVLLNLEINKSLNLIEPASYLTSPLKINALIGELIHNINGRETLIIQLENDLKYGIQLTASQVFDLYQDLLSNNKFTYNEVFEVCKALDAELFDKINNSYDRETIKFANFLEKYLSKQEKYNGISYDKNLFKFNASLAIHILNNLSIYGDKLTSENKSSNTSFNGIDLFSIIYQYLDKIEMKQVEDVLNFIHDIDVEFDKELFVKPKREVKIITSGKPKGISSVSNKGQTLKFTKGRSNPLSVYIDSKMYNDADLFKLLHDNSILYVYINGYGSESVRFAMDAINNGFTIYVITDMEFKSEKNGDPSTYSEFAKRYSTITIDRSLNHPTYKFYNEQSYGNYAYNSDTKSQGVLDYEKENETLFSYFDLFRDGVISTLPVSSSNLALSLRSIGDVVTIHDAYSKDNAVRKKITSITRINGGLQQSDETEILGSTYLKDGQLYVIAKIRKEKKGATQFILYNIGELNGSSIDGKTISISKNDLNRKNEDGSSVYTFLGNRQLFNGKINIGNKFIISCDRINSDGLDIVNYTPFTKESLYLIYEKQLLELSDRCGMTPRYLFNTIINDKNIESFSFVEFENITDDLHDNLKQEPNFTGLDFARLLASRIGTKINFVTGNQLYAMGFNPESNGLVYDGEIYLNMDSKKLNTTTVFHELSHLILAYMKNNNYQGYSTCLNIIKQNYNDRVKEIQERFHLLSYADACEEILAEYIGNRFAEFNPEKSIKYVLNVLNSNEAYQAIAESVYEMLGEEFKDISDLMKLSISLIVLENENFNELEAPLFPRKKFLIEEASSAIMARLEMNDYDGYNLTKKC